MKNDTQDGPEIEQLPAWVRWVAQDRNGAWWGYEHEPNQGDVAWYENEVGRSIRLMSGKANAHWPCTLIRVPG